jgi:hypothetical protein
MFVTIGLDASLGVGGIQFHQPRRRSASNNIGGASMRPDKETPQPGRAWGVKGGIESNYGANYATWASIWPAQWWGSQACTCYGEGHCLCCRRFDRAIRTHELRASGWVAA